MENFKKKIRLQLIFNQVLILFIISVIVFLLITENDDDFFLGFLVGALSAIIARTVMLYKKYSNEEKLKALYIAETDELNQLINKDSFSLSFFISYMLLIVFMIVFYFINKIVSLTLFISFIACITTFMLTKIYYKKKYM